MKLKKLRLDVEALFSQTVYGHGYLHYGYWPEGAEAQQPSLERLGKAQQHYFERLCGEIPGDVHRILDVGSGTGSNAAGLIGKGYEVECVCPSAELNELARAKLPLGVHIAESRFEDYDSTRRFDLLLFAESFHYIETRTALRQIERFAAKHVLICDYFPRTPHDGGTKPAHATFLSLVEEVLGGAFRVEHDEDITERIVPTFKVTDTIGNAYVKPFLRTAADEFRRSHRVSAFLLGPLLNRRIQRLNRRSNRSETFPRDFEYRLIRLSRSRR
jgi:SAM-dependent methyltransferase